jgi:hypothetical protein
MNTQVSRRFYSDFVADGALKSAVCHRDIVRWFESKRDRAETGYDELPTSATLRIACYTPSGRQEPIR